MIPTRLLPFAAVIRREFLRSLRQWRPVVVLVVALGFAAMIVENTWPSYTNYPGYVGQASNNLLVGVLTVLLFTGALLVPAYASACIISEREQDTYDLVRVTLVSDLAMVLGKLASALGFYAVYAIALLPFVATVFFLVGVDAFTFLGGFAIISAVAVSCAACGVACSAWRRSYTGAVICSYIGTLCILGAPLLLLVFLHEGFRIRIMSSGDIEQLGRLLSPVVALLELTNARTDFSGVVVACAVQLGIAAAALLVAVAVLRRRHRYTRPLLERLGVGGASGFSSGKWQEGRKWKKRRVLSGWPSIGDRANPLYVKEARYGTLSSTRARRWLLRGMILNSLFIGLLCAANAYQRPHDAGEMTALFVIWHLGTIGLLVPGVSANALTKERERGNLDLLHASLLSDRSIVAGKLLAGFRTALLLATPGMVGAALLVAFMGEFLAAEGPPNPWSLLLGTWTVMLVCTAGCMASGVLASAIVKRTPTAIVLGYILAFAFYFGSPILLGILADAGGPYLSIHRRLIFWTSPPLAFLESALTAPHECICPYFASSILLSCTIVGLVYRTAIRTLTYRREHAR